MISFLHYIDFRQTKSEVTNYEIISGIEKGQITPSILAKYCMPKKSFYDLNFITVNDIVELYHELKFKKPLELESVITQMVLPEFKYWSSMCVTQFENIINEKNTDIDYNHIYSIFHDLLQMSNDLLQTSNDLLQTNNVYCLDSHI